MRLKEIKPGMVIHCKTEEEFEALVEYLISNDYIFKNEEIQTDWKGIKYSYGIGLKEYGNDLDEISFSDTDFYLRNGYEITELSDIIIPELSAAEVLKICNEICATREGGNCSVCKMHHNCFFDLSSDYQKVVEICEQWKADHEKKEPEFEWVWQGRIYEIHDHDKGNFYQLKDGKGFYDTGCLNEESAEEYMEEVLKDYCKDHKGEFIAVVTHVCRVKGEK